VAPVLVSELFPEGAQGPEIGAIGPPTSIVRPTVDMSHRVDIGHTVHMARTGHIGHTSHRREPVGRPKRRSHVNGPRNTTYWDTTYWETTYWSST